MINLKDVEINIKMAEDARKPLEISYAAARTLIQELRRCAEALEQIIKDGYSCKRDEEALAELKKKVEL